MTRGADGSLFITARFPAPGRAGEGAFWSESSWTCNSTTVVSRSHFAQLTHILRPFDFPLHFADLRGAFSDSYLCPECNFWIYSLTTTVFPSTNGIFQVIKLPSFCRQLCHRTSFIKRPDSILKLFGWFPPSPHTGWYQKAVLNPLSYAQNPFHF